MGRTGRRGSIVTVAGKRWGVGVDTTKCTWGHGTAIVQGEVRVGGGDTMRGSGEGKDC